MTVKIKHVFARLSPIGLEFLFDIFNQVFNESLCSLTWRRAVIIPMLKKGKPSGSIPSYRPISLPVAFASCEKILKCLMTHLLVAIKLSTVQVGFISIH